MYAYWLRRAGRRWPATPRFALEALAFALAAHVAARRFISAMLSRTGLAASRLGSIAFTTGRGRARIPFQRARSLAIHHCSSLTRLAADVAATSARLIGALFRRLAIAYLLSNTTARLASTRLRVTRRPFCGLAVLGNTCRPVPPTVAWDSGRTIWSGLLNHLIPTHGAQ